MTEALTILREAAQAAWAATRDLQALLDARTCEVLEQLLDDEEQP